MWCPPQKRFYCPINKIGTQITTLELPKRLHILGVNHHLVAGICGNMFPEKTSLPAKQLETMENMKQTHIINIYTCKYIYIHIYIYVCIYIYMHTPTFTLFLASIKTNQKHTLLLYLRKTSLKMGSQSSSWKQRTSNISKTAFMHDTS